MPDCQYFCPRGPCGIAGKRQTCAKPFSSFLGSLHSQHLHPTFVKHPPLCRPPPLFPEQCTFGDRAGGRAGGACTTYYECASVPLRNCTHTSLSSLLRTPRHDASRACVRKTPLFSSSLHLRRRRRSMKMHFGCKKEERRKKRKEGKEKREKGEL